MFPESDDDERWWPRNPERDSPPYRSGEMVTAALGPLVALELSSFVRAASDAGVQPSSRLAQFFDQLEELQGRRPTMFLYLAVAMAVVQERFVRSHDETELRERDVIDFHVGETYKHLGSWVAEVAEQYGMSLEDFVEYVQHDFGSWPPPGIAYTRHRPKRQGYEGLETSADAPQGDLEFWGELMGDGRPSLVGAHLVNLRNLSSYAEALDRALEFAREDVLRMRHGWHNTDPSSFESDDPSIDEAVTRLSNAVEDVWRAIELIRTAQDTIVRVFPT